MSWIVFSRPRHSVYVAGYDSTRYDSHRSWYLLTMERFSSSYSDSDVALFPRILLFYLDKFYHTMNTSPESYDVFKYMREMLDHGVHYLVMEVSSQSLKLNSSREFLSPDQEWWSHPYNECRTWRAIPLLRNDQESRAGHWPRADS